MEELVPRKLSGKMTFEANKTPVALEALGCLAAARGRRSSARARQCWESLGAGLSGGGVSAPKEASRRPRRSAPTPPAAQPRVGAPRHLKKA